MTNSKMTLKAALKAYRAGDYAQAEALYRPLAEQRVFEARFRLAQMFHRGHVHPKNYLEAYDWYDASREKAPAAIYESLRRWIADVFRRAVPRNGRAFIFVQLLDTAWQDDRALKSQIARRLLVLAMDSEQPEACPALPADAAWILEGIGKALAPLRELAWETESQRQGDAWRAGLIGQLRGSLPVPDGGFMTGARDTVVCQVRDILRFSLRFDREYRRKLAGPPLSFSAVDIQKLGTAWIAASTQFIADAGRPDRAAAALGELERAMLGGSLRDVQLSPMPRTLEEARAGYNSACETGSFDEFSYWLLGHYFRLIRSARSLVRRGVISRGDLQLLIRLGPRVQAANPQRDRPAQRDGD